MRHLYGIGIAALGVATLSPDSTWVRLIASDASATLFWRGLAMAVGAAILLVVRDGADAGRRLSALRRRSDIALAVFFVGANILFVWSIKYAPVADALGSLATTSIFAAVLSAAFLRQRVALRVWLAALGVGVGLFVITLYGGGQLSGRLSSIGSALFFAATLVALKQRTRFDPLPAVALCGVILALLFAGSAGGNTLRTAQIAAVVGLGVILPLSMQLIGRASEILSAPEVSLVMLLETVLGTLWAWIFLNETPATLTIVAVALILITLAVFYAVEIKHAKARRHNR